MKAAYINNYGSNDSVIIGDLPDPQIADDQILVEIKAAGVNPVDFKIRDGKLKLMTPYSFPLILGCDLSGTVKKVGAQVTKFKLGDEVFARLGKEKIGSFAEFAAVNEKDAALKPGNLSHIEAASLPLVALTSWQALFEIGNLQKGQKVLIHAGSGGVGTIAIQIAKHGGAYVATTASKRNFDLVKGLGADLLIDYKNEKFEEIIKDYDIVFDTIGGETQLRSFEVLKRGGTLVTIAGLPTAEVGRDWGLNIFLRWFLAFMNRKATKAARKKDINFKYLFMRPDGDQLAEIGSLVEKGVLEPVVDRVFPLSLARDALSYVESGRATGKVVIAIHE